MSQFTLVTLHQGHEHSQPISGRNLSRKEAMKKTRDLLEIRSSKLTDAEFKAAGGVRILEEGKQFFPQGRHCQRTRHQNTKFFRLTAPALAHA